MTSDYDDDARLIGIAWQLDWLRWVPCAALFEIVTEHGACMCLVSDDEPPWRDDWLTDGELAARLCAGCPVQDECLELELRTAGDQTVGVWGALPERDRRVLHFHWLQRGERADGRGGAGGLTT